MPRSKRYNDKRQGVLLRPPNESDKILQILDEIAKQFSKELDDADFQRWLRDLARFPLPAIEYAFECWHNNGRFFPQPADIRDLCGAWAPSTPLYVEGCNAICKARHGQGYGESDILWLYSRYLEKREILGRIPSEAEVEGLMDELDKHRKRPPVWRAA